MEKSKMDDGWVALLFIINFIIFNGIRLTQTALNTKHNPSAVPFVDDG